MSAFSFAATLAGSVAYGSLGAQILAGTLVAFGHPRGAGGPPMANPFGVYPVPQLARNHCQQVLLGRKGRLCRGEPHTLRNAEHVRVHSYALHDAKCLVEHDVCRLSSHAGKSRELLHGLWHLATVVGHNHLGACHAVFRLCPKEAQASDYLCHLLGIGLCHGGGLAPAGKELGRYGVNGDVGGLCRQQHGDYQLKRRAPVQGGGLLAVDFVHAVAKLRRSRNLALL